MYKSYIWSIPTRVFHWLFASLILLAFLSEDDDLLHYHVTIGYLLLVVLLFRFTWGIFGPKYSKFSDFPIGISNVMSFLKGFFSHKYIGHNPLASYVMILILIVTFFVIVTGILTLGIQEGKGILSPLNDTFFKEMELFEEIHEFLANTLLFLIGAHLVGIAMDKLVHFRHNTLNSIFSGYKNTQNDESIKLSYFQIFIAFIFFVLFIAFLAFNVTNPNNILVASKYEHIDYEAKNSLFVEECASCHILYPPHILPSHSWVVLMDGLEDHFGDDASIAEEDSANILNFLVENSAENSTQEVSVKVLKSIKDRDIIAITHTPFWKKEHEGIQKELFEHEKIKSKANCLACHLDIEKGVIEDDKIQDINSFV